MRRAMAGPGLPRRVLGRYSGSSSWTKSKGPPARALVAAIVSAVGMLMLVGGQAEGAASFAPAANYAAGDNPYSVTTGRFNGDAIDDAAVVNRASGNVSVLLGNGDGTLGAASNYATGASPSDVAVGDLNGDGAADLAVANYSSDNVSVLLGNGDGTFGAAANYPLSGISENPSQGYGPSAVTVADFDADGDRDLAVANWYGYTVSVFRNNGSGVFSQYATVLVGRRANEVEAADLDNDGDADLAVGDSIGDYAFYVLRNNGSGSFGSPTSHGPVEDTFEFKDDLTVGDFDNDGDRDVASSARYSAGSGKVYVLLGKGDGTFAFGGAKSYPTGGLATAVTAANLDGDSALDLAVADYASDAVVVLAGKGDGTFGAGTTHGVGTDPRSVVPGSFGGPPGAGADLAVANQGSDNASILLNTTPKPPACSDLDDNDDDGKTDFPADPGCTSAGDDDETDPPSSCTITGTSSNDTLKGTSGGDVICGLGGTDTLTGSQGDDILRGGPGNDTLSGGLGDDGLEGGLGADTASYSGASGATTASLATNTANGAMGSDTFVEIENLAGSPHGDTLTGSSAANRLTGNDGSDELRAGSGNDSVIGGVGADQLYGQVGNDALNSKDGVSGNDSLDGGAGTDTKVTDAMEKSIVGFP